MSWRSYIRGLLIVALAIPGLFVAGIPCSGTPPAVTLRDAESSVAVTKNVMIPVRDGTRLAADIYRPARDGKPVAGRFPTLLTRTPYNKDGVGRARANTTPGVVHRRRQRRPRPLRQRRDLAADRRRSPGRLRRRRVDRRVRIGPTARSARSARAIPAGPSTRSPR